MNDKYLLEDYTAKPEANSEEKFNYNDYGFVDTSTYGEIEIHVSKLQ